MRPKLGPFDRIEADDALGAAVAFGVVGDEDFTPGHRGSAVAAAELRAPELLGSALGKLFEDAVFAPDAVAFGSEELGPIVGE